MLNDFAYVIQLSLIFIALSIDALNIYIFYRLNSKIRRVSGLSGLIPVTFYTSSLLFSQFQNHIPVIIVVLLIALRIFMMLRYDY
jgi:hypothetical protein